MSRWIKVLLLLLFLAASLTIAVALVLQLPVFGGAIDGERQARMQRSPHYVNGRFENTPPYHARLALLQNLRDYFGG